MKFVLTSDLHGGHDHNTHIVLHKFFRKQIVHLDYDVLLIAGDIISDSQKQLSKTLNIIRNYVSKPIVVCRGNHDLWCYDIRKSCKQVRLDVLYNSQRAIS